MLNNFISTSQQRRTLLFFKISINSVIKTAAVFKVTVSNKFFFTMFVSLLKRRCKIIQIIYDETIIEKYFIFFLDKSNRSYSFYSF